MVRQRSLQQPLLLPVAIILVGTLLRFFKLAAQSMWFDEAARLLIAQAPLQAILSNAGRDTLPPFFHLTIHGWYGLGSGDFWLRVLPAFAGVLSVAVVYRLGYAFFGRTTALIAACLMAVFPYQIFQSQQANLYSYLALFGGLAMLFFYLAITRNHWGWWIGYTLAVICGMYTHYFAAFTLLTLHLWLLIVTIRRGDYRQQWLWLLVADGVAGLLFLPQLASFIRETGVVASDFWLTKPNLVAPIATMHLFTVSYSLSLVLVSVGFLLTFALVTIAALELFYRFRRQPAERARLLFIFLVTFLPNIVVFLIAQFVPIYLERTLIIVTPAYCIFLGRALSNSHRKSPLPYLAALTGIVIVLSLFNYYFNPTFAKPDYRQAAAYVAEQVGENEVILHTANGSYLPFLLYIAPENHYLLAGDPAPHHPAQLHELAGGRTVTLDQLADYDAVWLVVALEHSIDWQIEQTLFFEERYQLLQRYDFDEINVLLYDLESTVAVSTIDLKTRTKLK